MSNNLPAYEPVEQVETDERHDDASSQGGPSSSSTSSTSSTGRGQSLPARTADGVFANLQARAQEPAAVKAAGAFPGNVRVAAVAPAADDKLPDYSEIHGNERIPTYIETVIISAMPEDRSSFLVDGMEVGNTAIYVVTTMITVVFGFFGFIMAHMMSDTHAGKSGAQTGLGITFIQYGIAFYNRLQELIDKSVRDGMTESEAAGKFFGQSVAVYLVVFMGWLIIFNACASYLRALRVLAIQSASSVQATV